jgi:hypothetical protein
VRSIRSPTAVDGETEACDAVPVNEMQAEASARAPSAAATECAREVVMTPTLGAAPNEPETRR